MTIKKIAQRLRSDGVRVTLKKRTDGGYIISSINGKKFAGKSGNAVARGLLNQPLTHRQEVQRRESLTKSKEVAERARVAKEKYGIIPNRTPTKTTKELRSLVTKANKALRTKTKGAQRVSMRKIKEALRRGESPSSIARRLRQTIRHAEGASYQRERSFWKTYFSKKKQYKWMGDVIDDMGEDLTNEATRRLRALIYSKGTTEDSVEEVLMIFLEEGALKPMDYATIAMKRFKYSQEKIADIFRKKGIKVK